MVVNNHVLSDVLREVCLWRTCFDAGHLGSRKDLIEHNDLTRKNREILDTNLTFALQFLGILGKLKH